MKADRGPVVLVEGSTVNEESPMSIFGRQSTATAEPVFDAPTTAVEDIAGTYTIDTTHSRLGFSARHAMVTTVRGQFTEFEGTAHIDTKNPAASSAKVTIKTASITTGQDDRDAHLRTGDFFDAETFPEITFVATDVARIEAATWLVTGDLTIKGVTNPVSIEFESAGSALDPFGYTRVGFEGSTTINRKDWGLTYNAALETGGVLISDKIKLEFDVSAVATPAGA
jgi:polyisoprenoid-binding protein YceI